jgi:hypothetical protein
MNLAALDVVDYVVTDPNPNRERKESRLGVRPLPHCRSCSLVAASHEQPYFTIQTTAAVSSLTTDPAAGHFGAVSQRALALA